MIHGGCSGADKISGDIGIKLGLKVIVFPAQWKKHGKRAGSLRNTQMLDKGRPDLVLAFHSDIEHSKGTKNMISQAKERNIQVILYK